MQLTITIPVSADWHLLCEQKASLVNHIYNLRNEAKDENLISHLTGILHLLDDIQDEASEVVGDKKIFRTG